MKKINISYPLDLPAQQPELVLVLGFFDGLHLGHQAVIEQARQEAQENDLPLALMTFKRHPALVFTSAQPDSIDYLTTNQQKEELLSDLGVDIIYELNFTSQIASLTAAEFVEHFILALKAQVVVAGYDYSFGHHGSAKMTDMQELAQGRFKVQAVDEFKSEMDVEVCSTNIRDLLKEGQLTLANQLLGRPYEMTGFVIHGQARGRELGYPTANVYTHPKLLVPKIGVYASQTFVQGKWYDSMTSIGYNVTFGESKTYSIESHLFDFDRPIYGEEVKIRWIEYLRDEIKFDGIEALIHQLEADEIKSRQILKD